MEGKDKEHPLTLKGKVIQLKNSQYEHSILIELLNLIESMLLM